MTADELIEKFKELRDNKFKVVDISIASLLREHPEQLDDFIDKYVAMQLEDVMFEEGESREEIQKDLADQFRELFKQ
jgi:hypothetical protein